MSAAISGEPPRDVVVNGVSARTGGGLTYLRQLLPMLAGILNARETTLHLLVNKDASTELSDVLIGSSVYVHTPAWASQRGFQRVLSEQALLPSFLRQLSAGAVLHTGDTVPLRSSIPSILLCRNMLLFAPKRSDSPRLRALRCLSRRSLRHAHAVAFVSHTLAHHVTLQCHIRNWTVIHHGPGLTLRPRAPRPPAGPIAIVVVSTLYDYKRIELAIDTVSKLRSRQIPATLDVVGRPVEVKYAEKLMRQVQQLGIGQFVRFVGEATPARVAEAYGNASLAFVTSATESFCHPILESFSAGIPVIVPTDLGVAREIAGNAAIYSEPSGVAFAQAAEALFLDPVRYQQLVTAGAERVGDFSWDRTAQETADLLLSCASPAR